MIFFFHPKEPQDDPSCTISRIFDSLCCFFTFHSSLSFPRNLGSDIVTIELDTPTFSSSQVAEVEEAVNECIRKQIAVTPTLYPNKDDPELQKVSLL